MELFIPRNITSLKKYLYSIKFVSNKSKNEENGKKEIEVPSEEERIL